MDDARSDSDFGDRDVSSGDESDVNESGQQQPGIIDKIEVADLSALPPPHGPGKSTTLLEPCPN